MKINSLLLATLLLGLPSAAIAQSESPSFAQFPAIVQDVKNIKVNLKSHRNANRFRTNLRNAAKDGVNFAGHFVFVSWGCGTNCAVSAIINARTGRVFFPQELEGTGFGFCEMPDEADPIVTRDNSRLLVINGYKGGDLESDDPTCGVYYFEWTGTKLRQVKFEKKERREAP